VWQLSAHSQLTSILTHVNIETGENYSWHRFFFDNIAYAKFLALCHASKKLKGTLPPHTNTT
jgi:hypothetical protein